jgi:hypothetical protein
LRSAGHVVSTPNQVIAVLAVAVIRAGECVIAILEAELVAPHKRVSIEYWAKVCPCSVRINDAAERVALQISSVRSSSPVSEALRERAEFSMKPVTWMYAQVFIHWMK